MTSLPDWLVERIALDEVPTASRHRLAGVDPHLLAEHLAALRAANERELAMHPPGPAVAQLESRVAVERRRRRGGRRATWVLGAAVVAVVALVTFHTVSSPPVPRTDVVDDGTRVKGPARLLAFRQAGSGAERLDEDALVHPGDLIQLRYHAGGAAYGVIASLDGAGVVTLHHPDSEDGSTALAHVTTTLPHAYALDDAPAFERFFFITSAEPIDVQAAVAAVRALAGRSDATTTPLELPAELRQSSLRLRKP